MKAPNTWKRKNRNKSSTCSKQSQESLFKEFEQSIFGILFGVIHREVDAATGLVDFHVGCTGQLKLRVKVMSDIKNDGVLH